MIFFKNGVDIFPCFDYNLKKKHGVCQVVTSENIVELNKNEKLFRTLYEAIRSRELKCGTRLAPEQELARLHNCSRVTVRNSLKQLEELNLIKRIRGRGTYVSGSAGRLTQRRVIAIVTRDVVMSDYRDSDAYLNNLMTALLKNSREYDFFGDVIFLNSTESFTEGAARLKLNLDLYDGLIFAIQLTKNDILALEGHNCNYVALQSPENEEMEISSITIDHANGGYIATQHLIDAGCRNIWFLCGSFQDKVNKLRLAGCLQAMEENAFPPCVRKNFREIIPYKEEEAIAVIEELLRKRTPCDGLFISGDWATIGVVKTLRKHGVRVPEDIAVVMYDDFSFVSRVLELRMTAVRQPFCDLITYAVRILLNRMENRQRSTMVQIIQPRLMIRDSTKTTQEREHSK